MKSVVVTCFFLLGVSTPALGDSPPATTPPPSSPPSSHARCEVAGVGIENGSQYADLDCVDKFEKKWNAWAGEKKAKRSDTYFLGGQKCACEGLANSGAAVARVEGNCEVRPVPAKVRVMGIEDQLAFFYMSLKDELVLEDVVVKGPVSSSALVSARLNRAERFTYYAKKMLRAFDEYDGGSHPDAPTGNVIYDDASYDGWRKAPSLESCQRACKAELECNTNKINFYTPLKDACTGDLPYKEGAQAARQGHTDIACASPDFGDVGEAVSPEPEMRLMPFNEPKPAQTGIK